MPRFMYGISVMLFSAIIAQGRPVRSWLPSELYEKADVVIIATVIDITSTGKKTERDHGENSPKLKEVEQVAKIRVQYAVKGNVPDASKITFQALDPESATAIIDGPSKLRLETGKTYLLYLKRTSVKGSFIGIFDGMYDEDPAAKEIKMALSKEQ